MHTFLPKFLRENKDAHYTWVSLKPGCALYTGAHYAQQSTGTPSVKEHVYSVHFTDVSQISGEFVS